MSNKPSKLKSKKEIQIGNFIISTYGDTLQYMKVRAAAGNWSETFRSDSDFYKQIDEVLKNKDENVEKYLHNLFAMHYTVCFGVKDHQFIMDVFDAYNKMVERAKTDGEITEEENQEIINEEKAKYEDGNNQN